MIGAPAVFGNTLSGLFAFHGNLAFRIWNARKAREASELEEQVKNLSRRERRDIRHAEVAWSEDGEQKLLYVAEKFEVPN